MSHVWRLESGGGSKVFEKFVDPWCIATIPSTQLEEEKKEGASLHTRTQNNSRICHTHTHTHTHKPR